MQISQVAVVGLGQMGVPMAQNLIRAGFQVRGFDVSDAARRTAQEAGIACAATLRDALADAQVIITMLPNGGIVRDALTQDDAYLAARQGAILFEMSSSAPTDTRKLDTLIGHHVRVVDAPVSGGVKRAVSGTLTVMAGGRAEDLEMGRAVLAALSEKIFHCGPVGAGHAMKSINNFVSGAGVIAACEGVLLGRTFGLEPETIVDVLNASSGRNNATEVKMKQFVLNGTFASGFALGLMAKDINIAAALARDLGLDLPELARTAATWSEATQALGGATDHTAIDTFISSSATRKS